MKKLFYCFVPVMLCLTATITSCSKDEPDNKVGGTLSRGHSVSTETVTIIAQENGIISTNGLTYNITSYTDFTIGVIGTTLEVDNETYKGGFVIPAYIKYEGERYTVTSIEDNAFKNFSKMTSVILPEGLEEIGEYAFYGCNQLQEITLPKSLNKIGAKAFYGIDLATIYADPLTPPEAEDNSFNSETYRNATLMVHKSNYDLYCDESPWRNFTNIYYESQIMGDDEEEVDGHKAIDLGLSVKWADRNIGAYYISDYGHYFAWGECSTKTNYTFKSSLWNDREYLENKNVIYSDGNLTSGYDVAMADWSENWRIPTKDEIKELLERCTYRWTTRDGVKGSLFTGPNGASIFLPAAGVRSGKDIIYAETVTTGYYWSSTIFDDCHYACGLRLQSTGPDSNYFYTMYGLPIRPVTK